MSPIDILINQIISQAMANPSASRMPGHAMLLVMKIVSVVSGLAGLGFLLLALYHWLEIHYSQQQSFVYMGFALFLISLGAVLVSVVTSYMRQRMIRRVGKNLIRTAGEFYKSAAAEIEIPLKDHQGLALLAAAIGGLFVGKKL